MVKDVEGILNASGQSIYIYIYIYIYTICVNVTMLIRSVSDTCIYSD